MRKLIENRRMSDIGKLIIHKISMFRSEESNSLYMKQFGQNDNNTWVWSLLNRLKHQLNRLC